MTDTNHIELKPCPFCGSDVESYQQTSKVPDNWAVRCDVCGAQCGPSASSTAARYNWNTRTLSARASAGEGGEAEWITSLRNEAMQAAMKDVFWLSRDQVFELIGGPLTAAPQPAQAGASGGVWAPTCQKCRMTITRPGECAIGGQHCQCPTGGGVDDATVKRAMDAVLPNGHRVWAYVAGGNPDPSVSGREVMRVALEAVAGTRTYRDAYEGAREDLLDWKGRALRAESRLRSLGWQGIDASEPPAPTGVADECETCGGLGWIDETLGGHSFSNPKAPCPDCDGHGEIAAAPQPQYPAKFDRNGSETTDAADMLTPPAHGDGEGDARAEFERWVAKRWGYSTERWADSGEYLYQNTRDWWQCWQAALTTRPTPEAQEARDAVDARRYRYLRDHCKREWYSDMPHNKGAPSLDIEFEARGHDLDAAIDAALALPAQGEGNNG